MAPQSISCSLHFQLLMNRAVLQQINFKRTAFPRKNSAPFGEKKVVLNKITPLPGLHLTQMQSATWMNGGSENSRVLEHVMLHYFAFCDTPQRLMGVSLSASHHVFGVPPVLQRELKMNNVAGATQLQWENVSSFVFMGAPNSSVSMTCCLQLAGCEKLHNILTFLKATHMF